MNSQAFHENSWPFFVLMENIHENQVEAILPYQYEPEPGAETSSISDKSDSEQGSVCFHLRRKLIRSSKEQTLGAFKL